VPACRTETRGPDDVTGVLPPRRRLAAAGALGAAAFCFVTGENLPVGLLPVMSGSLRSSLSATGLLVTVYAVAVVVASAPLTYLTRRVRRRFLLVGLLGVFVAGTLAAAAAPGYGWLMAARVVTALSQAVFWSIAAVAAAGMFPADERGWAVTVALSGGPLAILLGVPAGTWIGQHAGWRVSFVVVSGLGLTVAAVLAVLIPARRPLESHAAAGTDPDALRYGLLVVATLLYVAGTFTAYTYVSAFLTRVSGLPAADVPPVLLLGGLASLAGLGCSGWLLSRHRRAALAVPAVILAASMLGLYVLGTIGPAAAVLQAAESFGVAGFAVSMQARVLVVAPRGTDIASAVWSSAYNLGIAAGPVIGGFVLSGPGLHATPLAGGLLAGMALAVVLSEPLIGTAIRRIGPGASNECLGHIRPCRSVITWRGKKILGSEDEILRQPSSPSFPAPGAMASSPAGWNTNRCRL
jgi:DHA1 family inner membrane transport protein